MGPGIVVPLVVLAITVPAALWWFRRYVRAMAVDGEPAPMRGSRLTSSTLHRSTPPGWRVVHEIGPSVLGGIDHVLIGPPGVFAVTTSLDPVPTPQAVEPNGDGTASTTAAFTMADGAIARGHLDDLLGRCGLVSEGLLTVHWGNGPTGAREVTHGVTAVSGRSLSEWMASQTDTRLQPSQIDQAWQAVVTGIGRPDPLG